MNINARLREEIALLQQQHSTVEGSHEMHQSTSRTCCPLKACEGRTPMQDTFVVLWTACALLLVPRAVLIKDRC
jgi:hypothetical protein